MSIHIVIIYCGSVLSAGVGCNLAILGSGIDLRFESARFILANVLSINTCREKCIEPFCDMFSIHPRYFLLVAQGRGQ